MQTPDEAPLSGTERGKRDKARRIREASRAMFLIKGFDDATIRDIARVAEVAQGTLFLYAASKRDLLFMLYNDLIEGACEACQSIPVERLPLAEVLMRIALIHFQKFTDDLGIARLSLVHLNLYDKSGESSRFGRLHRQMTDLIERAFAQSRDRGALGSEFDLPLMAMLAMNVQIEAVKAYVRADLPDIRLAMRQTYGQFAVILRGLDADGSALTVTAPDLRDLIDLEATRPEPRGAASRQAGH